MRDVNAAPAGISPPAQSRAPEAREASRGTVALFGFVGSLIAVGADAGFKNEASATATIAEGINGVLLRPFDPATMHLWLPIVVASFLVTLGVLLCFAFEAKTPKDAIAVGASVLAIMMTFVPFNSAPSAGVMNATATPRGPAGLMLVQASPHATHVPITVTTARPATELTVVLRNQATGGIVGRSRFTGLSGTEHEFLLDLSVLPSGYAITLEAPGHRAVTCTYLHQTQNARISVNLEAATGWRGILSPPQSIGTCPSTSLDARRL